jgi:hypothetical protein
MYSEIVRRTTGSRLGLRSRRSGPPPDGHLSPGTLRDDELVQFLIEKCFIPGGLKSLVRQVAPHEQQRWTPDLAPEGAR